MNTVEVLNEAINLKSKERFILVEGILKSLDKPGGPPVPLKLFFVRLS